MIFQVASFDCEILSFLIGEEVISETPYYSHRCAALMSSFGYLVLRLSKKSEFRSKRE